MLLTSSTRFVISTVAVTLFAALAPLSPECDAQHRRLVFGQELGRFLGVGHGGGYHCANAGQNTGYYNPYTEHNSMLMSAYETGHRNITGYPALNTDAVDHGSYTGHDKKQHSVFESFPGRAVRPSFEPAVDRTQKKSEEATPDNDFDPDSDFEPDNDFKSDSDFGSDNDFDSPSKLDRMNELKPKAMADQDAGFDALKDNFDDIQESKGSGLRTEIEDFDGSSFLE